MNILIQKNNILLTVVFPFLVATMLNCEGLEMDSLKLTNNTSQTVYYQAMTVELSVLIDLNPIIPVDSDDRRKRIITPGTTATVTEDEIMSYDLGDDIQFYFYEVIGDTAYYSGELRLTHKKLRELKFQVAIDDEELTTRKVK